MQAAHKRGSLPAANASGRVSPHGHCAPDPLKYLVIPNGVAHAFEGLERIYTINRPRILVADVRDYRPGNDVIDWPLDRTDYPVLSVSTQEASSEFYEAQVSSQRELMTAPPMHATPMVLVTTDDEGRPVRVALRKRVDEATDAI